jgi:hypothetical protein
MAWNPSVDLGRKLTKALGLPNGVQRIVIVCDIDDLPKVYVKGILVEKSGEDAIVQAVKDVTVSDDGDVCVVALDKPEGA